MSDNEIGFRCPDWIDLEAIFLRVAWTPYVCTI